MLSIEELFKGRHFDREIIILCVRWYLRRNIWSEAHALQGPQRADVQRRRSRTTNAATRTLARRATVTSAIFLGRSQVNDSRNPTRLIFFKKQAFSSRGQYSSRMPG
jgi:hypothetical protein